jgi:hypothetical protein
MDTLTDLGMMACVNLREVERIMYASVEIHFRYRSRARLLVATDDLSQIYDIQISGFFVRLSRLETVPASDNICPRLAEQTGNCDKRLKPIKTTRRRTADRFLCAGSSLSRSMKAPFDHDSP